MAAANQILCIKLLEFHAQNLISNLGKCEGCNRQMYTEALHVCKVFRLG
jgi:hypothetical protein